MSVDDNQDIKPRPEIWEKGVIGLAALLTLAALGACIYLFALPAPRPQAQALAPTIQAPAPANEVTVGIFPSKQAGAH